MSHAGRRSTLVALAGAALVVGGALIHFSRHSAVRGNDRRIQEELGISCGRFEATALIGRKQGELATLSRLDNTVLLALESGSVPTGGDDGEFLREVRSRAPAAEGGRLPTRLYRICGLKIITILYGDEIVDTVFVPGDRPGPLFGIDP